MKEVIIFSSGPSLCYEDIILGMKSGINMIAVNSTWKAIPDCNYIFAADFDWWRFNFTSIKSSAELWTSSTRAALNFGVNRYGAALVCSNSGGQAIEFSINKGARNILLLGFDCSISDKTHWHGDHPEGLKNPTNSIVERWIMDFIKLNEKYSMKVNIINCSRHSKIDAFKRKDFSVALDDLLVVK